ncbi:MAG: hypothetical protein IH984_00590 [Planctomycetes bacterium]|nr:hypothetical protein [Planctomycetota bacterium]
MLRNSGISPEMPGCPKCLYIVRGWESSVCPECGTNVNGKKVRIGIALNRRLIAINAIVVAVFIILFALLPIGSWLFKTSDMSEGWTYDSRGSVEFRIKIETSSDMRRFPPKDDRTSMLKLDSVVAIEPSDLLLKDNKHVEEIMYWSRQGYGILFFDNADEIPTDQEISEFLSKSLQEDVLTMKPYAIEINQLISNVSNLGTIQLRNKSSNTPLLRMSGHHAVGFSGIWPPGIVILMLVGFLTIIVLPVIVLRRYRPGMRPVRNGEWLASTDPDNITN